MAVLYYVQTQGILHLGTDFQKNIEYRKIANNCPQIQEPILPDLKKCIMF